MTDKVEEVARAQQEIEPYWRVLVEFPMDANRDSMERAIRHAAGKDFEFSGGGLGMRDVGWHCQTEFEAKRLERSLKKIGLHPLVRELYR